MFSSIRYRITWKYKDFDCPDFVDIPEYIQDVEDYLESMFDNVVVGVEAIG